MYERIESAVAMHDFAGASKLLTEALTTSQKSHHHRVDVSFSQSQQAHKIIILDILSHIQDKNDHEFR